MCFKYSPIYKHGTRKNTCWNNQCSRNGMSFPSEIAREGNFRNGETKMPMEEVLLFLWEPSFCGQASWTLFVALFTMNKASGGDGITSSWAFSNLKRWCCESSALNMPANLEDSAVDTGLEKVSFHSSPNEGQCQRMFKPMHSFTHLTS